MSTVIETNRTIEVSAIDEDYMMDLMINVQSVVFLPGAASDSVDILENNIGGDNPIKVRLLCGDDEPRGWIFNQRLQLGFTFAGNTFSQGAVVIFNIGELKGQ